MTGIELVVLALATYRLTRLIYKDDIADPIRLRIEGEQFNSDHPKRAAVAEWLHLLITCPYCVGVWAAGVLILLLAVPFVNFFVYLLAVAGAASLIQEVLDTRDNLVQ